jgi:DNA-binding MarR family transcriptional regulator
MTWQPTAGDDQTGDDQAREDQAREDQAREDQAVRIWAAMRGLTAGYPPDGALRSALDLGRGTGRVKALLRLAEGPLSLGGIAEAVGADAPYATLIVDTLEKRGLVERRPDPADRRRKLVSLTAEGREAVARVTRIQRQPPPGFGSLSAAELDALEDLLRRLTGDSPGPGAATGRGRNTGSEIQDHGNM